MSDGEGNTIPGAHARAVLDFLVKSVVENPDAVEINTNEGDEKVSFEVHVGDGDMGRVIGKRGRVANAIRTVVSAAAVRDEVRAEVDFAD